MSTHPFAFATVAAAAPVAVVAAVPPPAGVPEIVVWLAGLFFSACGPAAIYGVTKIAPRVLAGRRARKASLKASKEARAKQLENDGDKTNDKEAARLRDEADALQAEIVELDTISGSVQLNEDALTAAKAAMKKHGVVE